MTPLTHWMHTTKHDSSFGVVSTKEWCRLEVQRINTNPQRKAITVEQENGKHKIFVNLTSKMENRGVAGLPFSVINRKYKVA